MNVIKFLKLLNISLLLFLVFSASDIYADKLKTDISRDKMALDETVTLTYTLDNNASKTPDFSGIEKDFRIMSTDYGNIVNMINGKISVQTYWRLTLMPSRAGELVIPVINFGEYKSESHHILVDKKAVASDSPSQSVFVQADVNSTQPFEQSLLLYTFKLFYQTQLANPQLKMPATTEGTFIQLNASRDYETVIKGKTYNVVEKTFAFFPHKSGKIILSPINFQAMLYDTSDQFAYNPFFIATPKPISLQTKSIKLDVRAKPTQFHGNTWLPADQITMTDKWSLRPDEWELNNPVTRTVTIEAQGLRADQIPDVIVDNIQGVNIYSDAAKRSNKVMEKTVVGTLEQKFTYIPSKSQTVQIPAITLPWWNLKTNKSDVAELKGFTSTIKSFVKPVASLPPKAKNDIMINPVPQPQSNNAYSPFYLSVWFWLASFLGVAWFITLWMLKTKTSRPDIIELKEIMKASAISEITEKHFEQACREGNAILAQQFLFSWIKKLFPSLPPSLETLYRISKNEDFKTALRNLEKVLYAKKPMQWEGYALLEAFKVIKKELKSKTSQTSALNKKYLDPLPPLNPTNGN